VTEGTKVHGTNLDFDDKDEQGKPKEKDKTPLGKLEKYCRKAFEDCLSGEGGEGRWDHDKERVLDLAWRVGVAARTVREGRGDKKRKVIFAYDVRMGLKFVNEHCQMQCGPTNDARQRIQRAYCLGALDKDGWPEEDAPGPDK
jgi:hypothetical protein